MQGARRNPHQGTLVLKGTRGIKEGSVMYKVYRARIPLDYSRLILEARKQQSNYLKF